MNNKPTLFVDSVTREYDGSENQNSFDSRRNQKGRIFHRIDDILSFMYIGKRVFVEVFLNNDCHYGEIYKIDNKFLHLKKEDSIMSVLILDIIDLKISSLN